MSFRPPESARGGIQAGFTSESGFECLRLPNNMRKNHKISVVIPAVNEEASIARVIDAIPGWVDEIVVADNGSADRTAEVARSRGVIVVSESRKGYGSACLAGIAAVNAPDVVVFLDGDFSDHPEEMRLLVDPIVSGHADLASGSRVAGNREPGALTPQALFGNWLACRLIRLFWKARYTDLGPFRAVRAETLRQIGMCDRNYGWMVEMQIKATRAGFRVIEVPVSYRKRIGHSKISGTVKGVLYAGTKILWTILRAAAGLLPSSLKPYEDRVILFTRYPSPGTTKTRLIPVLGPEGAARLHRMMAEHTLTRLQPLRASESVSIEVRFDGGDLDQMQSWLGRNYSFTPQGSGELGARISRAVRSALDKGTKRVIVIGTDCPGLTADIVGQAIERLQTHDVAIGPARDGGYYLIGLARSLPELFRDIEWGTDKVLESTLKKSRELGLSCFLLPQLGDVDRPEDIPLWDRERSKVT